MSWMTALCELYDRNANIAGKQIGDNPVLIPISHIRVSAQIEVILSQDGEFINARTLDEDECKTIIPVTRESSPTNKRGFNAHPLNELLKFVAKDFFDYVADDKEKSSDNTNKYFNAYLQQLNAWNNSEYTHPKVQAIAAYMNKSTGLIGDLLNKNIFSLNEKGKIDTKTKIQNKTIDKMFVRFVIFSDVDDDVSETWKDISLQNSFINYYSSLLKDKNLCYATGVETALPNLHANSIMSDGDQAKIISANDKDGLTYRGRFINSMEAFSVGYEVSHKAHNALKWIIEKQGYLKITDKNVFCFVSWESEDQTIPSIMDDSLDIISEFFNNSNNDNINTTNYIEAQKFNQALLGYGKELKGSMYLMTLEEKKKNQGRISITGFTTISSSIYVENIVKWNESCEWFHEKYKKGKKVTFKGMLGILDIAEILYGSENSNDDKNYYLNLSDSQAFMLNTTIKRLLPCISHGKKIPRDMVNTAVQRASSPVSYKDEKCWRQTLALACSMVKKLKYDYNLEVWNMALDTKCTDRSYLYGRLLAIADLIEQRATFEEEKGKVTNAKRYMNALAQRPFRTWQIIEEKLEPYSRKLKSKWLLTQLDEIHNMFSPEDYADDCRLDGLYLLGYHSQIYAINSFNKEVSETNDSEEND